jgi:hypothetical protein
MEVVIGLASGIVGATAGGLVTWWTTRSRLRTELEYGYDKELRSERVAIYRKVWAITASLPRYYWPMKPARSDLRRLIEEFHGWYFQDGGLFLTPETKAAYLTMMDRLDEAAGREDDDSTPLSDAILTSLFDAGESLRVQLANDVGAGHRPQVPSRPLPPAESRMLTTSQARP